MAKGGRPKTCSSPVSAESVRGKGEGESETSIPVSVRRNSDPRGFTTPTLSSLSKSKPVAIIKAYDEVADHKNLIEKSKVLEKLRSTQIRSPLLDQRRQELEKLLQTKSHEVIRNELSTILNEVQSFELELLAGHGDASYRLDVAKSYSHLDESTRSKSVENFAKNSDERSRLVHDLEVNVRQWTDAMNGSKRILKALQGDPIAADVRDMIYKTEQDLEMHLKACFAWSVAISNSNVQVMCRCFDDLSFATISNVCVCHQDLAKIVAKYQMNNLVRHTNEFQTMAEFLAEESASQFHCLFPGSGSSSSSPAKKVTFAPASSCCDLFPEHSAHETEQGSSGMSFENVLNEIILRNQRILFRMMFARYTPDERKPKKKPSPRKTWNYVTREKRSSIHSNYRQLDETFWNLFWTHFTSPLVHVFTDHDITHWPPLLHQIRNMCLSINELSQSALISLSKAYSQLYRVHCEHVWSINHRKMIQAMEKSDINNSSTISSDDQVSTTIGYFALCAVDPIVLLIPNCGDDAREGRESHHCLTLTINTLINWINCEDMNDWPIVTAVILVWGDLERLCSSLNSLGKEGQLAHFEQDVREVQVLNMKCILGRVSHNSRLHVSRNLPRSEYKSRSCRTSSTWMLECFKESSGHVMEAVNNLSIPGVEFLGAFLDGCLAELMQDPLKFSHSGAKRFASDAETLVTHVREMSHTSEADLLQDEQINNFLSFCRFITSGSPSAASSLRSRNKITPSDLMQFRKFYHSANCFHCCSCL